MLVMWVAQQHDVKRTLRKIHVQPIVYGTLTQKYGNGRNWLICVKNRDAAIDAMYVECGRRYEAGTKGPASALSKNHTSYSYIFYHV